MRAILLAALGLAACQSGPIRYVPAEVLATTPETISISYVLAGEKTAFRLAAAHCAPRAAVPQGSENVGPNRTTTTWRCEGR